MSRKEQTVIGFTVALLLGSMVLLGWESVNFAQETSLTFWFLLFMTGMIVLFWQQIKEQMGPIIQSKNTTFIGADFTDFRRDIGAGLIVSFAFAALITYYPSLAMALPHQTQSTSIDSFFTLVVYLSPLIEELFFRCSLFNILFLLDPFMGATTIIVDALIFAVYHWSAYGIQYYGNTSALVGATMFGLLSGGLLLATKSILTTIPLHMLVNFMIFGNKTGMDSNTQWFFISLALIIGVILLSWDKLDRLIRKRKSRK